MKNKKSKELKISKRSYKEFISGELVNLCIPSEDAIKLDGWADWFNYHENLKNTSHGIFPNTSSNQKKILKEIKRQLREALKAISPIPFAGCFMLVYKGRKLPITQNLIDEAKLLFAKA